jgi:hypothetical protein
MYPRHLACLYPSMGAHERRGIPRQQPIDLMHNRGMLTVAKLRRKPQHFHRFTGLTVTEFDQVLTALAPVYEQHRLQERTRRPRQRQVGAGRPFALPLEDRLLLGLVFLRLYLTQSLLAYLFHLDESTVSRELHQRLLPALAEVLPLPSREAPLRDDRGRPTVAPPKGEDQTPPPPRIGTLAELLAHFPQVKELFLDTTEQEVPRPSTQPQQTRCYSGKKKRHTLKTQVTTTDQLILHLFGGLPGSVSDWTLLRASGVMPQLPEDVEAAMDRSYEGAEGQYPHLLVKKPLRTPRGQKLTWLGRAYNQMVSRQRVVVEHVIGRVKRYRVMSQEYRGKNEGHEELFALVSGLVNYRALGRLTWALAN